jgi:integrase
VIGVLINNKITCQVEEYIAYKQSLGYVIKAESMELRKFASYTRTLEYTESLTTDLALEWASLNKNYSRWYMARRLETIHTFAVCISAFDSETQIPPNGVFGKCHGRIQPYIYTEHEIQLMMNEAKMLFSPDGIRAFTVETALGLLWSTGLRISELTSLRNSDVFLDKGYIFIHNSKFKKERIVVLHTTVIRKLRDYATFISEHIGSRLNEDYYFVTTYGNEFNTRAFEYAFQLIRPCLYLNGSISSEQRKPRLYDLRHTFACRVIKNWLELGEDVNQKLHILSTYLGHTKPEDTYWYLSATPELLSISCQKYELAFGEEDNFDEIW